MKFDTELFVASVMPQPPIQRVPGALSDGPLKPWYLITTQGLESSRDV